MVDVIATFAKDPVQPGTATPSGLRVTVTDVQRAAEGVVLLTLIAADGGALPTWTPGAHIELQLGNGLLRQYSLLGSTERADMWELGVLKEPASRGGSAYIHEQIKSGDTLVCQPPRNNFPLEDAVEYRLIAGGIGVTPLLAMAAELERRGKSWQLLYGGRTRASMGFVERLQAYGERVSVRPQDEFGLLDIEAFIGAPRPGCLVYVCGPEPLIAAVETACAGWPEDALHLERFRAPEVAAASVAVNQPFEIVLAQSGMTIQVGANESIADAVEREGGYIPLSCNEGTCGTCMTPVLEGIPDHRDHFLRGKMRTDNKFICCCVSRAQTPRLVLDL